VTSPFFVCLLLPLLTESFDTGLITMETDNAIFYYVLPFIGVTYSSEIPGLANTGTEQLALAPEWRNASDFDRNIIAWTESPGLLTRQEIGARMLSVFVPDIFNADYLDLVRQARAANVSFACNSEFVVENVTDKLCETINSLSLLDVVADLDIPLQFCYSADDTVVSSRVYTDVDINVFANPNVTLYGGPLNVLPVSGDHSSAVVLCSVAPLERFLNVDAADRPNLISPLTGDQAAMCALSKSQQATETETTPPSAAPTTSGATTLTFSRAATSSGTIVMAVALLLASSSVL
jgi:WD40 repeat protein